MEYIIEILHMFYSRICYDAVRDDFGSHRAVVRRIEKIVFRTEEKQRFHTSV